MMLRVSQGLGLGWNRVSFPTGLLVLKGHLRERDTKIFSFFSDEIMELLIWRERRDFRAMQKSTGQIERGLCLLTLIQIFLRCPLFFAILLETVTTNSLTRNSLFFDVSTDWTCNPPSGAWDATRVARPLGTWAWPVSSTGETVGR